MTVNSDNTHILDLSSSTTVNRGTSFDHQTVPPHSGPIDLSGYQRVLTPISNYGFGPFSKVATSVLTEVANVSSPDFSSVPDTAFSSSPVTPAPASASTGCATPVFMPPQTIDIQSQLTSPQPGKPKVATTSRIQSDSPSLMVSGTTLMMPNQLQYSLYTPTPTSSAETTLVSPANGYYGYNEAIWNSPHIWETDDDTSTSTPVAGSMVSISGSQTTGSDIDYKDPAILGSLEARKRKKYNDYLCSHCGQVFHSVDLFARHLDRYQLIHLDTFDTEWHSQVNPPEPTSSSPPVEPSSAKETKGRVAKIPLTLNSQNCCIDCGRRFKRKDSLRRHIRLVHDNINSRFNQKVQKLRAKEQNAKEQREEEQREEEQREEEQREEELREQGLREQASQEQELQAHELDVCQTATKQADLLDSMTFTKHLA